MEEQKNDPRKIWATITSLTTGARSSHELPETFIISGEPTTDLKVIAEEFNSYFLNIATNMTENLGPINTNFQTNRSQVHFGVIKLRKRRFQKRLVRLSLSARLTAMAYPLSFLDSARIISFPPKQC